ncbi:MAG: alkylmercury lyase family protein [Pseudomonadota bacterium]
MNTSISNAVQRLNSQLPLKARQLALPSGLASVHRATLSSLAKQGRPPNREELSELLDGGDVDAALTRLANDDLIVLNTTGTEIVGAYPMTMEVTPHHLRVNRQPVNAMCALDALSVGPMFDAEVEITSRCHVTGTAITIQMQGETLHEVSPSPDVHVGVRWQNPSACAAHSMCLEMVFLKDQPTAFEWQAGDTENTSLFNLQDAVAFGAGFFTPLLQD